MSEAEYQFNVAARYWKDVGQLLVQFEAALGSAHPAAALFPQMIDRWRQIGVVLFREYRRPWETDRPAERHTAPAALAAPVAPDPAILSRLVGTLNISVRAQKGLARLGVQTIGQLTNKTDDELLAVKNFGVSSLVEVRAALGKLGLKLGGD